MNARRFKSFLVAVREVERPPRALLAKAARLAKRFNARLELLHVIALPYLVPADGSNPELAKEAEISRERTKLERAAKRLRALGIDVTCSVVWDYPAADAIVRHVLKAKPDVVLAESHHHGKLARWFVTHTDWELIRACPCPLWLVKSSRLADDFRVMTAIDPFHAHSKPAALDDELLKVATFAAGDKGRIGATHFYSPPVTMIAGGMGEPVWVAASPKDQNRLRRKVTQSVHAVADRFDIAKVDQVIKSGDPAAEIPNIVKRWRANLLVMGAVSRHGLKRSFIGHTAERVIDATHCDVLIVKPRSFKTPVSRRTNEVAIPVPPI